MPSTYADKVAGETESRSRQMEGGSSEGEILSVTTILNAHAKANTATSTSTFTKHAEGDHYRNDEQLRPSRASISTASRASSISAEAEVLDPNMPWPTVQHPSPSRCDHRERGCDAHCVSLPRESAPDCRLQRIQSIPPKTYHLQPHFRSQAWAEAHLS